MVQALKDDWNRLLFRVEDILAADDIKVTATLEKCLVFNFQAADVQPAAALPPFFGFLSQHLGAGYIDKVNTVGDQQNMALH